MNTVYAIPAGFKGRSVVPWALDRSPRALLVHVQILIERPRRTLQVLLNVSDSFFHGFVICWLSWGAFDSSQPTLHRAPL